MVETVDILHAPRERVREIQDANLRHMIALCFQGHPYYQQVFKASGLKLADLQTVDDLQRLPLTYKSDYMRDPEAFRLQGAKGLSPYETTLWNVVYTTGTTTGKPSPVYQTTHDFLGTLLAFSRVAQIEGVSPDDVIANLYPLTSMPHWGFFGTLWHGVATSAAMVNTKPGMPYPDFPIVSSLDDVVRSVARTRATVLSGIASFVRRVIMRAEEMGADFSAVRKLGVSGEPVPKAMRDDIRERLRRLGAQGPLPINNRYSFTEAQLSFAECVELGPPHNPAPDLCYAEVVDEKTGQRLPDGEEGMLVITHLNRRGTVLLRFATGDYSALSHEPCPLCGRTSERVVAAPRRADSLVKIKGTLINPEVMMQELSAIRGIKEYQVAFTNADPADAYSMEKVVIRINPLDGVLLEALKDEVTRRMVSAIEMRPEVSFVAEEVIFDLARDIKAKRLIDERRPK